MVMLKKIVYCVYVDGQLGIPFDTEKDAMAYAKHMNAEGFSCSIYKEERANA